MNELDTSYIKRLAAQPGLQIPGIISESGLNCDKLYAVFANLTDRATEDAIRRP